MSTSEDNKKKLMEKAKAKAKLAKLKKKQQQAEEEQKIIDNWKLEKDENYFTINSWTGVCLW
jgi:hypothetical protein